MNKYLINCEKIDSREEMHTALSNALSFPDWYGRNLDALYDMLTDIGEETLIQLVDWSSLGDFAMGFANVMAQAALDNPKLSILLN